MKPLKVNRRAHPNYRFRSIEEKKFAASNDAVNNYPNGTPTLVILGKRKRRRKPKPILTGIDFAKAETALKKELRSIESKFNVKNEPKSKLIEPSHFVRMHYNAIERQLFAFNLTGVLKSKMPSFDTSIVRSRGNMKRKLWRNVRMMYDQAMFNDVLVDDERARLDEAFAILEDVLSKEAWNRNTQQLKETETL